MALIVCPHCGGQVSDTVERCIHCGKFIKEKQKNSAVDFQTFDKIKQNNLEEEFQKKYPKYVCPYAKQKALKCRRKYTIFGRIMCGAGAIDLLFSILIQTKVLDLNSDDTMLMIIGPIVLVAVLTFFIGAAFCINYTIKSKKLIAKYLLYEKLYQVWLLNEKNISKKVDFIGLNKKDKKYFENINPDLYL